MHTPGSHTPYRTIKSNSHWFRIIDIVVSSIGDQLWNRIVAHSEGHQLLFRRIVSPDDLYYKFRRMCKMGTIGHTQTKDGG